MDHPHSALRALPRVFPNLRHLGCAAGRAAAPPFDSIPEGVDGGGGWAVGAGGKGQRGGGGCCRAPIIWEALRMWRVKKNPAAARPAAPGTAAHRN